MMRDVITITTDVTEVEKKSAKNDSFLGFSWYFMGLPAVVVIASQIAWNQVLPPLNFAFSGILVAGLYCTICINRFRSDYHRSYKAIGLSAFYTSIGFVCILSIMAITRLDYSRTFLTTAYSLIIFWLALGSLFFRKKKRNYLIIKGGSADKLVPIAKLRDWTTVSRFRANNDVSGYDAIVVDLHAHEDNKMLKALADKNLHGIPVINAESIFERYTGKSKLDYLAHGGLYKLAQNSRYSILKRIWEVLSILLISPLIIPVMIIVAVMVKIDSKGPVLFTQERIGKNGKPFTLYKFRSMRINADKNGAKFASKDDDRITPFGAFIRKFRIDELPQFWNVIKGDMSLIGPRPEQPEFVEFFDEEIPFYSYRHKVRPGITGWAQIKSGYASNLEATIQKLEFDLYYVKNINFSLDLMIVYATLKTVLTGFGSR